MATIKPTFAKMGLKLNTNAVNISIGDQQIEVKQYLPINDKLVLISNVINQAADENNFANPIKLDVFAALEIVFAYTNITFTDKQKEDLIKLYDILESNNVFNTVISAIPEAEYKSIVEGIDACAQAIYTYRNSALGIMESISQDYSSLGEEASDIQQKLADPENLKFLKDILTKMLALITWNQSTEINFMA